MSKKKTSVLIISQYFPPDMAGGGTRSFNYAMCLTQQNFEVTVISAHSHLHTAVPKEYRKKLIHKERMYGFNLIRVWIPSLLHSSVKNRIILHLSFIASSLLPMFSLKPDIIFASEPNLFSIIPAYIYSKLRGGRVIRIVDDLWPEVIYERGYVKSKLLKKILDSLAKFSYSYPKFILPLTDEAKQLIHRSYDIDNNKIIVLEHGVDTSVFTFNEKEGEDYFVMMYSGALVESYDFDIVINAAQQLKNKNIKFVIRGKGILLPYIKEKKEKLQLANLIVDTRIVPYEEISTVLSKSDVLLVPMKNEYTLNLSLPTKILEFQAVGRPIICCSNGAPGNYVERTKSGIRVDCGDLNSFILAILKLESDSNLCKNLGRNGRKYVEDNLTFDKTGKRLAEIIRLSLDISAR